MAWHVLGNQPQSQSQRGDEPSFLLSLFYRADIAEPSPFLGGAGPAPATVVVSK